MKPIGELLKNLARPEVLEFGLVTNRLPSVNVGGKFEPVDDEAPTTDRLLEILGALGGKRHVEGLGDKPVQWTTRIDGLGVIAVAAIMRKDVVQARFTVVRRDQARPAGAPAAGAQSTPAQPAAAAPAPTPPPAAAAPAAGPAPAAPRKEPAAAPAASAAAGPRPAGASARAQPGGGPAVNKPQGPQVRPIGQGPANRPSAAPPNAAKGGPSAAVKIVSPAASAAPPPAPQKPSGSHALADAVPPPDDWDDDDEPTVQTLSPPLSKPPGAIGQAQAKAAAAAEQVSVKSPSASPPAPPAPASPSAPPPDDALEPSRPEPETAAPASGDLGDVDSDDGGPVVEVVEIEVDAPPPRRGSLPPEPDLDIEITRNLQDSQKLALELDEEEDDDEEGTENTVEIAPSAGKLPVARIAPSPVEAVPSTSPSAAVPEKDRPRGEVGLDGYLAMATAAKATDLHLVAGRPVLVRVASDLLPKTQVVAPEHVERIVREIVPPRLRAGLESEGSCDFALDHGEHGRFRVNVSRQRTGYKVSMRVLPREVPTFAALGLPDAVTMAVANPSGLVLVTGPAGHGKSTTIAAMVDQVNREHQKHVITVEDPIELLHPRKRAVVSQREIGTHARGVAEALDGALREDPDVLVVDDLADAQAVLQVLDACEAGCLVIASVCAPGIAKALARLVDLFDASQLEAARERLAGALRLVVGQRLVPSADRTRLHAAVEIVPWSIALYALLRDGKVHDITRSLASDPTPGAKRLDEALAELVRAQKVTVEVARQYADDPEALAQSSGRISSPGLPALRKV